MLTEGAKRIDLQPLVDAILVEEMRTWKLPKLVIVGILPQANAANLHDNRITSQNGQ